MQTTDVAPAQWPAYLDDLTVREGGATVDLEVHGADRMAGCTLCAVVYGGPARMSIVLLDPEGHLHTIPVRLPQRVVVHEMGEGEIEALEIRNADGEQTYLRFAAVPGAARPAPEEILVRQPC